jgi:hypothetical protein
MRLDQVPNGDDMDMRFVVVTCKAHTVINYVAANSLSQCMFLFHKNIVNRYRAYDNTLNAGDRGYTLAIKGDAEGEEVLIPCDPIGVSSAVLFVALSLSFFTTYPV